MTTNIRHENVIGVRIQRLNERVELVIECLLGERVLVNKHRFYGILDSLNMNALMNIYNEVPDSAVNIRFRELIPCLLISAEISVSEGREPRISVKLDRCPEKPPYDLRIDELFSRNE